MASLSTEPLRDHAPKQQDGESAFNMQSWQPTDTSVLQPTHLPLTRVPKAWERKPLQPFSRQKMGKVWKRVAPVEIRKRRSVGGVAAKPVKKIRLDGDGAVGVARWEGEGEDEQAVSPVRKIVLRRDRVGEEGLVALADEEEGEEPGRSDDDEGAVVEVFDEDGMLLDVDPDAEDEKQEWEDEEEEFNPTMMHLGDIVEQAQRQVSADAQSQAYDEQETPEEPLSIVATDASEGPLEETPSDEQDLPTPTLVAPPREEVVLPEGFVSPVKSDTRPSQPSARKSYGSRRRTLPTEWRPSRLRQSTLAYDEEDTDAPTEPQEAVAVTQIDEPVNEPAQAPREQPETRETDPDQSAEQEWEDVEDEPDAEPDADMGDASVDNEHTEDLATVETEDAAEDDFVNEGDATMQPFRAASPVKLPSSPVPSVEGQHPRLPLRRSPRRKSSSPVKQSTLRPSTEQPHLVAFTPIKGLQRFPAFNVSPNTNDDLMEDAEQDSATPLLERSVSAPPEEPTMSPQRPSRPRLSDDTALLQAFLNRAAETKSTGRRMSTSKRESMTNRRDSDAVRHALASPAKPEVLADLDPNSPSPRKTTVVTDEVDDANILPEPESSPLHKTRRSGRATRKAAPQTATPAAAPNKISIRGNSENVVLKKSEAQEVSQLTRTNTRKNKGGSVLPLYRLAKLQQQGIVDPLDDGMAVDDELISKPNSKGKALRWNETLVEVWQGGDVSETSMLSDELSSSGPAHVEDDTMGVETEAPASQMVPPPPAETPSKPKIRRLKATRTAATPRKAPQAPVETGVKAEEGEKAEPAATQPKAPASTKRRSRIATPAKGLSNSSLLPPDLEPAPAPAPAAAPQSNKSLPTSSSTTTSATGRDRKAPASKLPAPATNATAATNNTTIATTTALGQGKENLISSPPKKKPTATSMPPSAKTFAPRLDFGKSLAPPIAGAGSQDDALPGLASPAKKVGRRGGVMFAPSMSSGGSGGSQEDAKEEVPLGLRSPAKKRTRRAVGGGGR